MALRINYVDGELINGIKFIREVESVIYGGKYFRRGEFLCDCGNVFVATMYYVKSSKCASCGCKNKLAAIKSVTTHGLSKSPMYKEWKAVKARCYNKNNKSFVDYGGRGICMSNEFLNSPSLFINYVKSLENFGVKGYTLDRIDNDGNYETGNLRWADRATQKLNSRIPKTNKTTAIGVSYIRGRYQAFVGHNRKHIYIGVYSTLKEAVIARNEYVVSHGFPHKLIKV